MKNVLIEGWRGISQSFAMVNQYQLIELAKLDGFAFSHLDLPYSNPSWNETGNDPSFPPEAKQLIKMLPAPKNQSFESVYSISFPFRLRNENTASKKLITFMTGEYGLQDTSFLSKDIDFDKFTHSEDLITAPSNWSRMKVIEFGFNPEKVIVIPHGVSSDIFYPLSSYGRDEVRLQLGIDPECFVFLNVGAMTWNKGIDLLLLAFTKVRQKHANARLVLKDASTLYGIQGVNVVGTFGQNHPEIAADILESIKVISSGLSLYQMRVLYGSADVYVSPYRAEGFNLPVIEAIACGVPVIVTEGGSTDDFCESRTSRVVQSNHVQNVDKAIPGAGYHLEPSLDSLIEQMELAISEQRRSSESFEMGRQNLIEKFSWKSATKKLADLF